MSRPHEEGCLAGTESIHDEIINECAALGSSDNETRHERRVQKNVDVPVRGEKRGREDDDVVKGKVAEASEEKPTTRESGTSCQHAHKSLHSHHGHIVADKDGRGEERASASASASESALMGEVDKELVDLKGVKKSRINNSYNNYKEAPRKNDDAGGKEGGEEKHSSPAFSKNAFNERKGYHEGDSKNAHKEHLIEGQKNEKPSWENGRSAHRVDDTRNKDEGRTKDVRRENKKPLFQPKDTKLKAADKKKPWEKSCRVSELSTTTTTMTDEAYKASVRRKREENNGAHGVRLEEEHGGAHGVRFEEENAAKRGELPFRALARRRSKRTPRSSSDANKWVMQVVAGKEIVLDSDDSGDRRRRTRQRSRGGNEDDIMDEKESCSSGVISVANDSDVVSVASSGETEMSESAG